MRNHSTNWLRSLGGLLGIALLYGTLVCEALAGTVRLRSSATVAQWEQGVRLGDIAQLEGDDVAALSGVVVADASDLAARQQPWIEVDIETVRARLVSSGASMGRVAISGARCVVRLEGFAKPRPKPEENAPAPEETQGQVVAPEALPTIRGRIADALAELFGVGRSDIRLKFEERDESLLAQTEWGRRIVVQPGSNAGASRVLVEVRVYAGDRLVENRRVAVDVEIRRRVVKVLQTVQRRSEITRDVLAESVLWIDPSGPAPIRSADAAVGSRARTRLEAGNILRETEIEAATVVRRNELVTVHCLRAGFEVRTRARAQSDAAVGDVIEFMLDGSRRAFQARVDGPGRAVVNLDAGGALAAATRVEQSE